jgi:anti-sigma B factor antagonist
MQLRVEDFGKFQVCSIIGAINASNSERFNELFMKMMENCAKDLIVNLEQLEFIDSKGISTFLVGKKILAKNGHTLSISNPPRSVRKVLDITFLNKVIPIYNDISEVPGMIQP